MLKNLLIWMMAIALSVTSGATAMGAITKYKSTELALSLFPLNGFAAEAASAGLTKASVAENLGKFPDRVDASWSALAYQAFESEPIVPDAIAVMALSQIGDVRFDLMRKAFELSRREQLVTGWLISDSGNRNDIPVVLTYYDTSLRTSASAADVIIPVMANALGDQNLVQPFETILKRKPPWAEGFWKKVAATPKALENAANLRQLLHKPEDGGDVYQDAALITALVKANHFEKAEQLYTMLSTAETKEAIIKNADFAVAPKYPPIDWTLFSTGEYGASLDNNRLNLSAVRNSGGLFARQLTKLPKGILLLKVNLVWTPPKSAKLYAELSCAENKNKKQPIVRILLDEAVIEQKISNHSSSCEYYWLDISGRSSDIGDGFDISIDSFEFLLMQED